MKKSFSGALVLGFVALLGCGDGGSSGTSGGGGSGSGNSTGASQTCMENHDCVNGACKCTDGPNKDRSCCDPNDSTCTTNKCDSFCKYCM